MCKDQSLWWSKRWKMWKIQTVESQNETPLQEEGYLLKHIQAGGTLRYNLLPTMGNPNLIQLFLTRVEF